MSFESQKEVPSEICHHREFSMSVFTVTSLSHHASVVMFYTHNNNNNNDNNLRQMTVLLMTTAAVDSISSSECFPRIVRRRRQKVRCQFPRSFVFHTTACEVA